MVPESSSRQWPRISNYYIDDVRIDSHVASVFKLTDLTILYSNRLKQLGTVLPGRVHSTKLKYRVKCHIFRTRRSTKLACEHDADSDCVHLARAANIVRRVGQFSVVRLTPSVKKNPCQILSWHYLLWSWMVPPSKSSHATHLHQLRLLQSHRSSCSTATHAADRVRVLRVYHARPQSGDPLACVHGNAGAHKDSQTRPGWHCSTWVSPSPMIGC